MREQSSAKPCQAVVAPDPGPDIDMCTLSRPDSLSPARPLADADGDVDGAVHLSLGLEVGGGSGGVKRQRLALHTGREATPLHRAMHRRGDARGCSDGQGGPPSVDT